MTDTVHAAPVTSATAKMNVGLLAVGQALFMCVTTMAIATTPFAGYAMLGTDKTLATLPLAAYHCGIMMTTIPASLLMAQIGRTSGFSLGALLTITAGGLSAWAIYIQNFPLLCFSALTLGASAAFAWYYRFAAADAADDAFRPKAIALVMAGGIVAGVLGPETAKHANSFFAPVQFAGVYVMMMVYGILSLLVVQFLRIPRLTAAQRAQGGRPMREIMRQHAYIVALASSMFGYGVMTLVMTSTPLAMKACGFEFNDSAFVIQGHVVAMFLPSFFTGHLISRFGVLKIIAAGVFIQMGCAAVNLAGVDFMHFFIANVLVGIGWNFTFVGGTTLLTTTYRPEERAKVQGSHDFMVYSTTAIAAGISGVLQAKVGWAVVNMAAIPLMGFVLIAALYLAQHQSRTRPAPAE